MISTFLFAPLLYYLYERWRVVCLDNPYSVAFIISETVILGIGAVNMCLLVEGMRRWNRQSKNEKRIDYSDITTPPHILIIIPTCGEGVEILSNTIEAVDHIDYPKDKLTIVVSDDASDKMIQEYLVVSYPSVIYRVRKRIHGDAKAGNLNDTLFDKNVDQEESKVTFTYPSDFVLVLDCDMAPRPDILQRLIPYLYKKNTPNEVDPSIGFVQSPQNFINIAGLDFLGQKYIFFYRIVLRAWSGHGMTPCCGTNVLFSRYHLHKIGGFLTGSVTEDFKTSLAMHAAGVQSRYCGDILADGLAPLTLVDFINQRSRWAIGGLQIYFSSSFRDLLRIPLVHRWLYGFSCLSPFTSLFLTILVVLPFLDTHLCGIADARYLYTFLPYTVAYIACLIWLHWGVNPTIIITSFQETVFMIPVMLYISIVYLLKSMGVTQITWRTTPKQKTKKGYACVTFLWLLPYLSLCGYGVYTIGFHRSAVISTIWAAAGMFQVMPIFLYLLQQQCLKK